MGQQRPHETQQGEMQSPVPGEKQPRHQYLLEATHLEMLSEKDLGGHQVEQEPAQCPCSKEGKWHPGLQ